MGDIMEVGQLVRKLDWVGLILTPIEPIRSGANEIAAGAYVLVTKSHGGLSISSEPCDCCNVTAFITGVPEWRFRVVARVGRIARRGDRLDRHECWRRWKQVQRDGYASATDAMFGQMGLEGT